MPLILPKSYKGFYPFQLTTTSFIYPEDYAPNVRRLGPFFDGIELLFLECGALPSASCVRELKGLGREYGLSYNVHLPSDVSIGHPDPQQRACALEALLQTIQRVGPLTPCTHTLHIPREESGSAAETSAAWRQRMYENLTRLVQAVDTPSRISVETLDYPFETVADIITALGLSICMDVGHLLRHGQNLSGFFERYGSRVTIIHLHGAQNGRDHLSLDRLPQPAAHAVLELLSGYEGVVSLEVFAFEALAKSLDWLEARLKI